MISKKITINEQVLLKLGCIHHYVDRDYIYFTKDNCRICLYKDKVILYLYGYRTEYNLNNFTDIHKLLKFISSDDL